MINGILIVFFVIGAIVLINLESVNTKNMEDKVIKAVILVAFLAGLTMSIGTISKDIGYRQGQIDALTNNVRYKLITLPDSTKVWKRIGDKK